jgi:hypothetical protein
MVNILMQNEIENAECRIDNRVIFWVVFYFTPDLRQKVREISVGRLTVGQLDKMIRRKHDQADQQVLAPHFSRSLPPCPNSISLRSIPEATEIVIM